MVGIGVSTDNHSDEAGRESASIALGMAGERPAWAIALCGGQHKPEKILPGIRSRVREAHIALPGKRDDPASSAEQAQAPLIEQGEAQCD